MATRIASLYAEIGADTRGLTRGLQETESSLTSAKRQFTSLTTQLASVGAAFAAVGFAAKQGYDLIKEGAALDAARGKFDNLSASIGTTSDTLLNDLRGATKGMVSDANLVAGATDLINLGLARSHDEVTRMSRVVGGLNLDLQVLGLTLANDSTARLDSLGLSMEDVRKKAQELQESGFVGDAFDEAVIQSLEDKMVILGDASETTAGKLARFEASWQNLTDSGKTWLADVALPTIDALNTMATVSASAAPTIDNLTRKNIESAKGLGDLEKAITAVNEEQRRWGGFAAILTGTNDDLVRAQHDLAVEIARSTGTYEDFVAVLERNNLVGDAATQIRKDNLEALYLEAVALDKTATQLSKVSDEIEVTVRNYDELGYSLEIAEVNLDRLAQGYEIFTSKQEAANDVLGNASNAFHDWEIAANAAGQAISGVKAIVEPTTLSTEAYALSVRDVIDRLREVEGQWNTTLQLSVHGLDALRDAYAIWSAMQNPFDSPFNTNDQPDPMNAGGDRPDQVYDAPANPDVPSIPTTPTPGPGSGGAGLPGVRGVTVNVYNTGATPEAIASKVSQAVAPRG